MGRIRPGGRVVGRGGDGRCVHRVHLGTSGIRGGIHPADGAEKQRAPKPLTGGPAGPSLSPPSADGRGTESPNPPAFVRMAQALYHGFADSPGLCRVRLRMPVAACAGKGGEQRA